MIYDIMDGRKGVSIFMEITSLTNTKVKTWAKYKEKKHRDKDRKFIIEGEHLIQEAKQAGLLECLIVEKDSTYPVYEGIEVYEVTTDILRKLTSLVSKETLLGICCYPAQEEIQGDQLIVLDNVQDPGNLGTIIRSALSFGYDGIVLSHTCVDLFNEKVIRSTQGAIFHIPVYRKHLTETLPLLKQQGYHIYATSLHDAKPLRQVEKQERFAMVFGNEGQGVSEEVLVLSDENIIIEMKTFESLNVAVAASICMYEFMK